MSRWGGSFNIQFEPIPEDEEEVETDNAAVIPDDILNSWRLAPGKQEKRTKDVNLGCIKCDRKIFYSTMYVIMIGIIVMSIPIIINTFSKHKAAPPQPDKYTVGLHAALKFFNAQKSGHLRENNGVPWRGDSGRRDGWRVVGSEHGLVGGYYDSGNNMKVHFPMAFSMTLLSWSIIEYGNKYKAAGEYEHAKDVIKWGVDYLLLTFNSSTSYVNQIYTQVGTDRNNPDFPQNDEFCWQRPEDMNYFRMVHSSKIAPNLGAEVASALAAASIVFRDDDSYSKKLIKAATIVYNFAIQASQVAQGWMEKSFTDTFYNSTSYWDEILWGASWMYFATGDYIYLDHATDLKIIENARGESKKPDSYVFSWDNKLPGIQLLLSRLRIFLDPGYPYEEMLSDYHSKVGIISDTITLVDIINRRQKCPWRYWNCFADIRYLVQSFDQFKCCYIHRSANSAADFFARLGRNVTHPVFWVGISMCSYLQQFGVFNWSEGGLIQLNHGQPRPLQYVVNAAFLGNLFADYMSASSVPGWFCGPNYFTSDVLRSFAASQVNYILGANPKNMSYVVGYGKHYPTHVRHRGASIPSRHVVSCTDGWIWRDAGGSNPNVLTGAMVGGPDSDDEFSDVRSSRNYNEPTLAGNAGLVAALVSLTGSGGSGIDKNTMFSSVMPPWPSTASPPPPWTP